MKKITILLLFTIISTACDIFTAAQPELNDNAIAINIPRRPRTRRRRSPCNEFCAKLFYFCVLSTVLTPLGHKILKTATDITTSIKNIHNDFNAIKPDINAVGELAREINNDVTAAKPVLRCLAQCSNNTTPECFPNCMNSRKTPSAIPQ